MTAKSASPCDLEISTSSISKSCTRYAKAGGLSDRYFKLVDIGEQNGFARDAAIVAAREAINENDQERFGIRAREVFRKVKGHLQVAWTGPASSYHLKCWSNHFSGLWIGSVGCFGLVSGFTWRLLSSFPSSRLGFGPGLISVNMLFISKWMYLSKAAEV